MIKTSQKKKKTFIDFYWRIEILNEKDKDDQIIEAELESESEPEPESESEIELVLKSELESATE